MIMAQEAQTTDWLARYAKNYHVWKQCTTPNGKKLYKRPLGIVESAFDTDGTYYGGRADMNAFFTVEIRHELSKSQLRHRIALAWANLRLQHVLLQSRIQVTETGAKELVVDIRESFEEIIQSALETTVWVEDSYDKVDSEELYKHCLNVSRIIEPEKCFSRLHVLPLVELPNGNFELRFLVIMAHQISDGLSAHNWFSHFLKLLNTPEPKLRNSIDESKTAEKIYKKLPPAQEDLYPLIPGNKARQRWFWAIIRVLRHIRKPLPPNFTNPLHISDEEMRKKLALGTPHLPPKFPNLFNYSASTAPPLKTGHIRVSLSQNASNKLIRLCRSSHISIGSGCFALAGLAMMEIQEQRHPNVPASQRPAFTAGFPLNPRAFFKHTQPADSCMLAFSEGIVMPFLPSSLPIKGRFRLTAKHANRELRMYQKRVQRDNNTSANVLRKEGLADPHSPGRILANCYVSVLERLDFKLPNHLKTGMNPQGSLQPPPYKMATCGVSSLGSTAKIFSPGMYDLNAVGKGEVARDFAADYRDLKIGVRARDGEFLVGSMTDWRGRVVFSVSYDGSAIPQAAAEEWGEKIRGLLDGEGRARL